MRATSATVRPHVHRSAATDATDDLRITPRQAQILEMIAKGDSNKHIARHLGVSERTVKTHLERLFLAHGFHSRAQAVAAWARSENGTPGREDVAVSS